MLQKRIGRLYRQYPFINALPTPFTTLSVHSPRIDVHHFRVSDGIKIISQQHYVTQINSALWLSFPWYPTLEAKQHYPIHYQARPSSKLCLCLDLFENRLHLGSLHDISLDLELSTHEQLLRIRFTLDQLAEIRITE